MRFSLFHNFDAIGRWHEYHKVLRDVVEIAQLVEDAGFWSVWYPEQHFRLEGNEASPKRGVTERVHRGPDQTYTHRAGG